MFRFRRAGNVYFLLLSVLMYMGTNGGLFDSPLAPFTTVTPLAIVLTISMVKEAIEDFARHKYDFCGLAFLRFFNPRPVPHHLPSLSLWDHRNTQVRPPSESPGSRCASS